MSNHTHMQDKYCGSAPPGQQGGLGGGTPVRPPVRPSARASVRPSARPSGMNLKVVFEKK